MCILKESGTPAISSGWGWKVRIDRNQGLTVSR